MTAMWNIVIHNVAKPPATFMVFERGVRRPAEFPTRAAAEEGCRIIEMLRSDSAFLKAEIVPVQ